MDTLEQGSGKLFTDPSSIAARADFQQKSRAMTDKVTTVSDAVDRLLGDGDYLAIGGFGGEGAEVKPGSRGVVGRHGRGNGVHGVAYRVEKA